MSGNDSSDDPGLAAGHDAEETRTLSQLADHPKHARWSSGHLSPGQRFGHFEIQRLLGAGGMGEVYEAFDHNTGRYVALKILNETLDDPEHRKRFLREGQLAARVSHPNSIYVYGTEEIEGHSVIVMELAAAGTLKDRVKADGPMQPREAVDAVLQILDGLEAAASEGVLHRDVKPSNCFVEPDGTVKIGDFGLSISTLAREETQLTMSGSIVGTPAFASPEQLSGRALDVGADIYSVGATLFYLLTGRPPFEADRPVELIARVLSEPASSVRKLQRKVPRGLARTVARCLAKDPSARFADHAALRYALTPHAPGSPGKARIHQRLAAASQDLSPAILVYLAQELLSVEGSWLLWGPTLLFVLVRTLGEGWGGRSPGKATAGLRVVGVGRPRVGLVRALVRNVILIWPFALASILTLFDSSALSLRRGSVSLWPIDAGGAMLLAMVGWPLVVWLALKASPGIGPHDWIAGTRVVRDPEKRQRQPYRAPDLAQPRAATADDTYIGPYRTLERLASDTAGETYLAYDDTLQRRVWVRVHHEVPDESVAGRDLDHRNALRWINGRRTSEGIWDAWEFVPGETPQSAARSKRPWRDVRGWLQSLAWDLLDLGQTPQEGRCRSISPANLWVAENGRVIVADFPFEDASPCAVAARDRGARLRLLASFSGALLEGRWRPHWIEEPVSRAAVPMPLHARSLLRELRDGTLGDEALDWIQRTSRLLEPEVSVRRRLDIFAGFAFVLVSFVVLVASAGLGPTGWRAIAADLSVAVLVVGLASLGGALLLNRRLSLLGNHVLEEESVGWRKVVVGAALVDSTGRELRRASQPLLIRTLVAWTPAWLAGLLLLAAGAGIALPDSIWLLPPLLLLVGGVYALANPEQGIQDRVAGTYLVPR